MISVSTLSGLYIYSTMGVFDTIWLYAHLLPGIAVTVRRLHDTGRSGRWLLRFVLLHTLAMVLVFVISIFIASSFGSITGIFLSFGLMTITIVSFEIWILLLMTEDSHPGENKYGPNPKGIPEAG